MQKSKLINKTEQIVVTDCSVSPQPHLTPLNL